MWLGDRRWCRRWGLLGLTPQEALQHNKHTQLSADASSRHRLRLYVLYGQHAASPKRDRQEPARLSTIQKSRYWNDTAIIITLDEHGGFWDHLSPPLGDRDANTGDLLTAFDFSQA
jgi:hypothetical protein